MRTILYTLIVLCFGFNTYAQTRMIGETHYQYNDQLAQDVAVDSIHYTYTSGSGRGCIPYGEHNYDTSFVSMMMGSTPLPILRKIQLFDAQDRVIARNTETLDNSGWLNYMREGYTYDAGGKVATDTISYFMNGSWQHNAFNMYVYNNSGTALQFSYSFSWNSMSNQWDTAGRHTYEYDGNSNMVQMVGSMRVADTFQVQDSTYFFYNSSNLCVYKFLRLLDDPSLNSWIDGEGIAYKYNTSNKLLSQYTLTEQLVRGHIDTVYRFVNTYDINGDISAVIYSHK